jgi:hypothetical protein
MILVFGMILIGNLEAQTDSRLNGAWVQVIEGMEVEIILGNGNFEELYNKVPWRRGTFTTNNEELAIKPTHVFGGGVDVIFGALGIDFGIESKWYTINEYIIAFRASLLRLGATEREVDEFVQSAMSVNSTSSYSVDSNTLILNSELLGQNYEIIFTKKQ